MGRQFQSSPADEGRCCWPDRGLAARSGSFNPHRPMKAGAARIIEGVDVEQNGFQSSPADEGRCCPSRALDVFAAVAVSILTGR